MTGVEKSHTASLLCRYLGRCLLPSCGVWVQQLLPSVFKASSETKEVHIQYRSP